MFLIGGVEYKTKIAVIRQVQQLLKAQLLDQPFESVVLADLVHRHHYYCAPHNLRPQRFRKAFRATGGYTLEGWFEGVGWHGVSYRKCLTPPTFEDEFNRALREACRPFVWSHRKEVCDRCGGRHRLEVDHLNPTFAEIYRQCVATLDARDRLSWDAFDWLHQEDFRLPQDSPAVQKALELHKTATFRTLCSGCHRNDWHGIETQGLPIYWGDGI